MNGKWAGLVTRFKSRNAYRIFGRRYSSYILPWNIQQHEHGILEKEYLGDRGRAV
jgi:hypothetical protein